MSTDTPRMQSTVFGDVGNTHSATITTDGRTIRPILSLLTAENNEGRVHISPDGLHASLVDASNVYMLHLTVHPEAFDTFEYDSQSDEFVAGVNLSKLQSRLRNARMGTRTNDDVRLTLGDSRITIDILREYDNTALRQSGELLGIDPNSIRQEPDMPELDMAWQATVDVDAFKDAIEHIDMFGDYVTMMESGGDLSFKKDADEDDEARAVADFGDVATVADVEQDESISLFSIDYLKSIATALKKGKIETVTLKGNEEFPMRAAFQCEETVETDDGEEDTHVLYEGEFLLAPRIQSGGESE